MQALDERSTQHLVQLRWLLACVVALCAIACSSDDDDKSLGQGMMPALAGGSGGTGATAPPPPPPTTSGTAAMPGSAAGGSNGSGTMTGGASDATQAGMSGATSGSGGAMAAADAGMAGDAGEASASGECTRELLSSTVDKYFAALAAHDSSMLPLAEDVKLTENGDELELSKAPLWMKAGMVKFEHSALDTELCMSVTESVVPDGMTDIPFGLRLKLEAGKITEIETIAVRSGDYFTPSNTKAISDTASEMWEAPVAADERATRDQLKKIVDDYFNKFPAGACNFADDCRRLENGFSPGNCSAGLSCSMSAGSGRSAMMPRLHVFDVDTGIAVGFVMFAGSYTDFHMFRVSGGEVHGVHAILASADSPGW